MSISDAIARLCSESRAICQERDNRELAAAMTADRHTLPVTENDKAVIKRIELAFRKMDTAYWEDFLKNLNEETENGSAEGYEERMTEALRKFYRQKAIYDSYEKILQQPHHADELLKKLKQELKNIDGKYDKMAEQMGIDEI